MESIAELISNRLPELLRVIQESDARTVEIHEGAWQIRLTRAFQEPIEGVPLAPAEVTIDDSRPTTITSLLVGTFFRAAKSDSEPLVREGSRVERHTVVGLLESLHDLIDVEAGCDGTISAVVATDGQPVEYGQVLFEVEPSG